MQRLVILVFALVSGGAGGSVPETQLTQTNLQVLAEDVSRDELLQTMKEVSRSLGVECNFCHRTETPDYASDEIPQKRTARRMMRMVDRLNRELFTWAGAPIATCYMCHRGESTPRLTW